MKTQEWIENKIKSEQSILKKFKKFLDGSLKMHDSDLIELYKMEIHVCNIKIELLEEILED